MSSSRWYYGRCSRQPAPPHSWGVTIPQIHFFFIFLALGSFETQMTNIPVCPLNTWMTFLLLYQIWEHQGVLLCSKLPDNERGWIYGVKKNTQSKSRLTRANVLACTYFLSLLKGHLSRSCVFCFADVTLTFHSQNGLTNISPTHQNCTNHHISIFISSYSFTINSPHCCLL